MDHILKITPKKLIIEITYRKKITIPCTLMLLLLFSNKYSQCALSQGHPTSAAATFNNVLVK